MSPLFRRAASTERETARIAAFWIWWSGARSDIAVRMDDQTLETRSAAITGAVRAIDPGLAWEMGRGVEKKRQLCINGGGGLALRALADRIVAAAPSDDEEWEYHPARLPHTGDHSLVVGDQQFASADARFLALVDNKRERIDVTVWHPGFVTVAATEHIRIAYLTLDGLLGEDGVERWLGAVEVSAAEPEGSVDGPGLVMAVGDLSAVATGDKWTLGQATGEKGTVYIVLINTALKGIDHLDKSERLDVAIQFRDIRPNGLPDPDESKELDDLEDRLQKAIPDAVHAGRVTGGGRRTLTWYVSNGEVATKAVATVADGKGWKITVKAVDDPGWTAYAASLLY